MKAEEIVAGINAKIEAQGGDIVDWPEEMQRQILEDFIRVRKSIQRIHPLFPMIWPRTRQGIRELPGFDVFNRLDPVERYFFFVCALGQSVKFERINKDIEQAIAAACKGDGK